LTGLTPVKCAPVKQNKKSGFTEAIMGTSMILCVSCYFRTCPS